MDHKTYLARTAELGGYWERFRDERWPYIYCAALAAESLKPHTALEIGTNGVSILSFSDTFDLGLSEPDNPGRKLYGDATQIPWPIEDAAYDLVVALQVLEHLTPHQEAVWREIRRVAKAAIITLPFQWHCPADPMHHGITDETIRKWTLGDKPYMEELVRSPSGLDRILLAYRFG